MQDRFKFRFWDKETLTMQKSPRIELRQRLSLDTIFNDDRVIFMQCTGLKDKNGKLIYEGDIVFNNCGRWIIKYCDKCKSLQCFENHYGCFACLGDYNWTDFIEDLNNTIVEGNIYENPELLKDGE